MEIELYEVPFRHELRIVGEDKFSLTARTAGCEISGCPLKQDQAYDFFCVSLAVSACQDAQRVEVQASQAHLAYVTEIAPGSQILVRTPTSRLIIAGSKHSGRSTLSRSILNWSIRLRAAPVLYADLDPRHSLILPEGCLAAVPVSELFSPELEMLPAAVGCEALAFFFGRPRVTKQSELYHELSLQLLEHCKNQWNLEQRGCVIKLPAGLSATQILEMSSIISATDILVLDDDKLVAQLRRALAGVPPATAAVVQKIQKSSGAICLPKRALAQKRLQEYFFGNGDLERPLFKIFHWTLNCDQIKVVRMEAPSRATRPIGSQWHRHVCFGDCSSLVANAIVGLCVVSEEKLTADGMPLHLTNLIGLASVESHAAAPHKLLLQVPFESPSHPKTLCVLIGNLGAPRALVVH